MSNKKAILLAIGIACGVVLLPALLYVAFGFLSCANANCSPESRPEITY
jgi:hypothetical protein